MAEFFTKPIDTDRLLKSVHEVLGLVPKQEPPAASASATCKILFVDDENDWRFMGTVYLQDAGYEVLAARDTAEALAHTHSVRPDLIILDLNLAGDSGVPLIGIFKEQHPGVPVLVYTGIEHDQNAINDLQAQGADQYLRKGTMGELLRTVQSALASVPAE